jgi:hypothetical protein
MEKDPIDLILAVSFGPEEFLKIHRVHLIIRLGADAITVYFFIVDAQHGATADHIIISIQAEGLHTVV